MKVFNVGIISLDNDFKYFAKVIKFYGRYFYQVNNLTIEINKDNYDQMTSSRWHKLAYFHVALKLHFLILKEKKNPIS